MWTGGAREEGPSFLGARTREPLSKPTDAAAHSGTRETFWSLSVLQIVIQELVQSIATIMRPRLPVPFIEMVTESFRAGGTSLVSRVEYGWTPKQDDWGIPETDASCAYLTCVRRDRST